MIKAKKPIEAEVDPVLEAKYDALAVQMRPRFNLTPVGAEGREKLEREYQDRRTQIKAQYDLEKK